MRNIKDFQERYNRWKNGERYWDIRGVDLPKYDDADKETFLQTEESAPQQEIQIPYNSDNQLYGATNTPYVGVEPIITAKNLFGITPTNDPNIWQTTNGDLVQVDSGNSKNAYGFINPRTGKYMVTEAMQNENDRAQKRFEDTQNAIRTAQAMGLDPTLPFVDAANGQYKKAFNDTANSLSWLFGPIGGVARAYVGTRELLDENGLRKTYKLFDSGQYNKAGLSFLGDLFNGLMATQGGSQTKKALEFNIAKKIP